MALQAADWRAVLARVLGAGWRRWREQVFARRQIRQLPRRHRTDPEYDHYLASQVIRAHRTGHTVIADRTTRLLEAFLAVEKRPKASLAVLCLGCRNGHELEAFRLRGFRDVTGIDLCPADESITAMDMHALTFEDRRFDVIYACHALEHALEPAAVMAEIRRVARPGAVCVFEVPVRYRKYPDREDVQDFESVSGLRAACATLLSTELFSEEVLESQHVVRLIFRCA